VGGEAAGKAFDTNEKIEETGLFARGEFAGVELGQNVVNIKDYGSAAKLGEQCAEDHEVRNGVDVKKIVALAQVVCGDLDGSAEKELRDAPGIGELIFFVEDASLQAMNVDAVEDFLGGLVRTAQGENVDMITALGES
jgi:hypothetical protein